MVCPRFAVVLVIGLVFADIAGSIGFAAASPTGLVTKELSGGITQTMRPLPNNKKARVAERDAVFLTGQNCASICGGVAGEGPNQVDCNQIIDALNAQGSATFTVQPYSMASWVQASCTIEFIQSTADTVTYSYDFLGTVASYLSDTCNAANGYAEGRCIFDGREDAIWVGNTDVSGHQARSTWTYLEEDVDVGNSD